MFVAVKKTYMSLEKTMTCIIVERKWFIIVGDEDDAFPICHTFIITKQCRQTPHGKRCENCNLKGDDGGARDLMLKELKLAYSTTIKTRD